MAKLHARILSDSDRSLWQALWLRGRRSLVQHWEWAAVAAAGVCEPVRLGVFDGGGELRAGVAFVDRPRKMQRTWAHPAPAPWAGLLCDEESLTEEWLRDALAAIADAVPSSVDFSEIVFQPEIVDGRGLAWAGWRLQFHYTYQSEVLPREQILEAGVSNLRRRAAKGDKAEVVVREESDGLDRLVALHGRMAESKEIGLHVGDACWTKLVEWLAAEEELGFQIISGGVGDATDFSALVAWDANVAFYLLGASDPDAKGSEAPTVIHLDIFDRLVKKNGPRLFDWCGANTSSVVQFKKQFRPRLVPLLYAVRHSRRGVLAESARRLLRR